MKRKYVWNVEFDGDDEFHVSNSLSTDIKYGNEYNEKIYFLTKKRFNINHAFYVHVNGVDYYLAITQDNIKCNEKNRIDIINNQVLVIQLGPRLKCSHKTRNCYASLKILDLWIFSF